MKVVSTWAALEILGPAYVWPTEVYYLGDVQQSDRVIVDPTPVSLPSAEVFWQKAALPFAKAAIGLAFVGQAAAFILQLDRRRPVQWRPWQRG